MLEQNVPADEENLRKLKGYPVCIIMNDGARYFGLITDCKKGKVVLNSNFGPEPIEEGSSHSSFKPEKRKKRAAERTKQRSHRKADVWTASGGHVPEAPFREPFEGSPRSKIVLPLEPIEAVLLL